MSKCEFCGKEMLDHKGGCLVKKFIFQDPESGEVEILERDTTHFHEKEGVCHDCGVPHGEIHHIGCDVERCPKCGMQFIGCECPQKGYIEVPEIIKIGEM